MPRFIFVILLFVAAFFAIVPAATAQKLPDENVIVTANAYPVPFENLSKSVTVLTREDIHNLPAHSIAEAIAMMASLDLRPRAPFGLQADLSIRGSAFSQVLVLVDGVRINDAQTGHHNSDFPVQLQDVERIEVLRGPGSSIYGADAFGGIINIITRRNAERPRASVAGGEHGFLQGSFSAGFRKGAVEQTISATGDRSSGFQYDRDFRNVSVSARTGIGSYSSFFVSHVNKEFGADNFYGPSPSREWTSQTLVSAEQRHEWRSGPRALFQEYYRTHGDRFLYDIRTPGLFENSHRTHSTGMLAKVQSPLANAGSITFGGDLGGDWIRSSNLGDHGYARASLFTEVQWSLGKTASVYPGLRFDYYSNFGSAVNPSLSGSWWVVPRIRLRTSVGRAFRIPTFTELYYRDPNHQASASLKPESAWSAEFGADFIPAKNWLGSATLFARRERNVIDWVRGTLAEKWHTANIRSLRSSGAEVDLEHRWGSRAGIAAHYRHINIDPGAIDYISKYVLDYARTSWSASVFFPMPISFSYRQTLNYKKRSNGQDYWLLDGRLERPFGHLVAGIDFTNLFNSQYQEITGVDMPGRWFIFTLRTR